MKIFLSIVFSFCILMGHAQTPDEQLNKRLQEYLNLTKELKFEELMDYIHPALFRIAPKDQLVEVLQQSFENEEFSITVDSIRTKSVSPIFVYQSSFYYKVDYYMEMSFHLKDKSLLSDSTFFAELEANFRESYPNDKIVFHVKKQTFTLIGDDILIAILDQEKSPWKFLGYDKQEAEAFKTLLPEAVVKQFKLN